MFVVGYCTTYAHELIAISYILVFLLQIVGLDQFMTKSHHLGNLNQIHADLLVSNLNLLFVLYPCLSHKQVKIFVEANLSHDLAASVQTRVRRYYGVRPKLQINFVKQHDSSGKLLPGVLTRHKANMVSYFKTALDQDGVFIARQLSTVTKAMELKYGSDSGSPNELGVMQLPSVQDMEHALKTFVQQATMFRCYSKGNGSVIYSGKRNQKSINMVDDLVMAVIIAVAWARLPQNSYVLEPAI